MQYGEDVGVAPLRAFFRNKWVRTILILDVVVIFIVAGILIWQATKVSTIIFNIAPIDATISVNGNTNYTNGQYSITPGTYEINISREGLEAKTLSVDIEPHYVVTVNMFLVGADNDFEFYELKENYASYDKLKSIASAGNNITIDQDVSAENFIDNFQKNYELYQNDLPIDISEMSKTEPSWMMWGVLISRSDDKDCKKTLCIEVVLINTENKELVIDAMNEHGFNLKEFEIRYEIY